MSQKVEIGDHVKVLDDTIEGTVVKVIDSRRILIADEHGFEYTYLLNELVIIKPDQEIVYLIDENALRNQLIHDLLPVKSASKKDVEKKNREGVIEIDLHLEELVEHPELLHGWQRLYTQMQHVKRCMRLILEEKVRRVVFIHGVGKGILKTEIINYVAQFPEVAIRPADSLRYGKGATEILLKY